MTLSPELSAAQAHLDYVDTDAWPGYTRRRRGKGFSYHDPRGNLLRGPERDRVAALVIPPAWQEVWICPVGTGHILATGRDERGRKQYVYHPRWNAVRQEAKYHGLVDFAEALPSLRARVREDLKGPPTGRETVFARGIRLVEATLLRVGGEGYARENGSRGLTTLEKEHVHVLEDEETVILEFTGKSGVAQSVEIDDPELVELVLACLDTDSERVLAYEDEATGELRPVTPGQLNAYIMRAMGTDHTMKTFRTWGGTVLATSIFLGLGPCPGEGRAKTRALTAALDQVAERLGNTRAVCKAHYVHPGVIDAYAAGTLAELARHRARQRDLSPEENVALGVCRELRAAAEAVAEELATTRRG
ncbi:MAG: DNA topoisomerase IB [Myxococcales bacterium]|nr:DNA topoisomerase IB [Myxococcales bacterium]MCB9737108.1 DNA topoisomerase IB [Deltaproteobacteria bacterium]